MRGDRRARRGRGQDGPGLQTQGCRAHLAGGPAARRTRCRAGRDRADQADSRSSTRRSTRPLYRRVTSRSTTRTTGSRACAIRCTSPMRSRRAGDGIRLSSSSPPTRRVDVGCGYRVGCGRADTALIPTLKRKEDEAAGVLSALAQLYVHGHCGGAGPRCCPPAITRRSRELHSCARSTGSRSASVRRFGQWPRTRCARRTARRPPRLGGAGLGRHRSRCTGEAAAAQVLSDVALGASVSHAAVPEAGTLITTLTPHLGGASVQVHAHEGAAFGLLFEAVVTSVSAPVPGVGRAGRAAACRMEGLPPRSSETLR